MIRRTLVSNFFIVFVILESGWRADGQTRDHDSFTATDAGLIAPATLTSEARAVIFRVVAVQDQLATTAAGQPSYPASEQQVVRRDLLVLGNNLPRGMSQVRQLAPLKAESPVNYWVLGFEGDQKRCRLEFEEGMRRAAVSLTEAERQWLEQADKLLLRAKIAPATAESTLGFRLNGAVGTWDLKYGQSAEPDLSLLHGRWRVEYKDRRFGDVVGFATIATVEEKPQVHYVFRNAYVTQEFQSLDVVVDQNVLHIKFQSLPGSSISTLRPSGGAPIEGWLDDEAAELARQQGDYELLKRLPSRCKKCGQYHTIDVSCPVTPPSRSAVPVISSTLWVRFPLVLAAGRLDRLDGLWEIDADAVKEGSNNNLREGERIRLSASSGTEKGKSLVVRESEVWKRDDMWIEDVVVVQDQTEHRDGEPRYPFEAKEQQTRDLFLVGRNLPDRDADVVELRSLDPGGRIQYRLFGLKSEFRK